ncbi:MAG: hypothetical protein ABR597_06650 [Bacteroidales bacterium]
MQLTLNTPAARLSVKSILLDVVAIAFVYLVPTFSHMLSFPLYYIEPMRIMVILAMIHTHRNNAYILALTLPLVSFALAAHPVLIKSMLIAIELVAMVAVFQLLHKRIHMLAAIFLSIWISKLFYYLMKFAAVSTIMPDQSMIGIALHIQLIVSIVMSFYVFMVMRKSNT